MNAHKSTLPLGKFDEPLLDSPARKPNYRFTLPKQRFQFTLHKRIIRWFLGLNRLFIFTVVVPTTLVAIYFGLIASDVYVSSSSFVIESVQDEIKDTSAIGSILKSVSSSSDNDTASVQEFMESRDALRQLNKELDIQKHYSGSSIDFLSRFGGLTPWNKSFESFYKYYVKDHRTRIVTIQPSDASSAILELEVRAFSANEAFQVNQKLLDMGEKLVNDLNDRLQKDMVHFAEEEVATAAKDAENAQVALADYRNANKLVDPEHQSSDQLDLTQKLEEELLEDQNQLAQVSMSSANNPQIPMLRDRINNLQAEIAAEMKKASGQVGSFTNKASEFERLTFQRECAEKELGDALSFLNNSRNQAQRQALYLKRIVEPNLPDIPIEPWRARYVLATLIVGLAAWGILTLFVAGVREHQQ